MYSENFFFNRSKFRHPDPPYLNHINNKALSDVYFDNARAVGIDFDKYGVKPGQTVPSGSTDMGNVSHVVPSIHPTFYIGTDVASHTRAFALAAGMFLSQYLFIGGNSVTLLGRNSEMTPARCHHAFSKLCVETDRGAANDLC